MARRTTERGPVSEAVGPGRARRGLPWIVAYASGRFDAPEKRWAPAPARGSLLLRRGLPSSLGGLQRQRSWFFFTASLPSLLKFEREMLVGPHGTPLIPKEWKAQTAPPASAPPQQQAREEKGTFLKGNSGCQPQHTARALHRSGSARATIYHLIISGTCVPPRPPACAARPPPRRDPAGLAH